jgi:uracil phosphoribosyltransferase
MEIYTMIPNLFQVFNFLIRLDILVNSGINQEQILFVGVICAQEGLDRIHHKFPKIKTIIAAHDSKLNDKKFIMPGLGDFGDRFFGTE